MKITAFIFLLCLTVTLGLAAFPVPLPQQAMFFGGNASGTAPPFTGPVYAVNNSGSATTNSVNAVGAKLIVIQCNGFSACHSSGSGFGDTSSNTYTAIGTTHCNSSLCIQYFYVISPTTSSSQHWVAGTSDTLHVFVYGPPTSGGTTWAPDSSATGYDTPVNDTGVKAALSITPTVAHDIIVTGISDNIAATVKSCTIVTPGLAAGTDGSPNINVSVSTCTPSSFFIVGQPITLASVNPGSYNGTNYLMENISISATVAEVNNGTPFGSSWVSGGTLQSNDTRYIGSTSGGCAIARQTEYNTSSAKETGAGADNANCNSTSAQNFTWIQYLANFIGDVVAFKPQ